MQKDFCLGSEWLYYKIYTGVKTSDYILLEKLQPVITHLIDKKIISQWFFIRYNDPEEHLRIRFLVTNKDNLSTIIQTFYPVFNELIAQNLVWKIQTDTYKREIERYGKATMQESEFLFWKNSELTLKYIEIKASFSMLELPLLYSFYTIDSFLNSFELSNYDKLSLMNNLQLSFKKEFNVGREQKKEMDKSYRELQLQMQQLFSTSLKNNFPEIYRIVDKKINQTKQIALEIKNKIEIPINDFLSSHIHMMVNRQYTSKQRMYELIIYDHLHRYYKTQNYTR